MWFVKFVKVVKRNGLGSDGNSREIYRGKKCSDEEGSVLPL